MPTTYTNGLKLPDLGSIDWYSSYKNNIDILDPIVGAVNSKQEQLSVTQLAAVNSGVTASAVQQIGTNASNISSLQTAVATKAADADVVHKAGAETITGDKTFTGAVVTHNITPEADNTYSLGSTSYQWASVYAQTYYYKGTAWGLDKYNQWTGVNDFNNLIGLNNAELWFKHPDIEDITTNPSTDVGKSILQIWNKRTTQYFGGIIDRLMTNGSHRLELVCFGYPLNSTTPYQHRFSFEAHRDGGADFYTTYNGVVNLGTSTNKWKTLNGINPGALSFPANSYVAIDTTNFNKTGGLNTYTPPSDGWIGIQVSSVSYREDYFIFIGRYTDGSTANPSYWSQGQVSPLMAHFEGYIGQVFIPVIGGKVYHIRVNGDFSSGGYIRAYFFPCLGNV